MSYENKTDTLELIESRLKRLPVEKLPAVLEFVEFLEQRTPDRELLEAMLLAQPLLAKDWLSPEEEEAWSNL